MLANRVAGREVNAVYAPRGMETFGERVSRALGWPLVIGSPVGRVETCYVVGMYDPPLYLDTLANTKSATHRVIHWCGSDVSTLTRPEVLPEALHLAEWDNLHDELLAKGIETHCAPMPTDTLAEVSALPEARTVGVYLGSDPATYGADVLEGIIPEMQDAEFVMWRFGESSQDRIADLYRRCRVNLRLTFHDGSCVTPREFMRAGRRAVITARLPYATQVRRDDVPGIVAALRTALSYDEPDWEAAAYYAAFNGTERYLSDLRAAGVL